jgi:hypothetical protein
MQRTRTRTMFIAVAVAATTMFAACGDSTDSVEGATDTTVAGADSTAADGSASDTSVPTSDTGSGEPTGPGKDTEFCQYQQELNNMTTPFDDQNSGATEFEAYFTNMVNPAIDKLESIAPAEISAQMTILADGLRKFSAAFEKNGWDPEKAYADPDLQGLSSDTAYNEAGTAVDTFCGF